MKDKLLKKYPILISCEKDIDHAIEIIIKCYKRNGKLLICGNGGSCSDSGHITGELMKSFKIKRELSENEKQAFANAFGKDGEYISSRLQNALPTISLPDQTAILTAFNNDVDASLGYAQLVWGYGKTNDVLLCISTSGNSKNILNAAKTAIIKGIKVISLVGNTQCSLDSLSDCIIHAPCNETADIQELHLPIYHYICAKIEKHFFA